MKGKSPKASYVDMVQQVLPGDTNPLGTVFGGKVMAWIDTAGAVAAMRHAQQPVVTASFDQVDFHAPARTGDVMVLHARLNGTGRTSMEVEVRVEAEHPWTGKRVLTTEALITYVAIDKEGRPAEVVPLVPETAAEKARFAEATERRKLRAESRRKRPRTR